MALVGVIPNLVPQERTRKFQEPCFPGKGRLQFQKSLVQPQAMAQCGPSGPLRASLELQDVGSARVALPGRVSLEEGSFCFVYLFLGFPPKHVCYMRVGKV